MSFFLVLIVLIGQLDALPQAPDTDSNQGNMTEGGNAKPLRGIQILRETCRSEDITIIENAILDASRLAGAGLAAATNPTDLPFKFFFPDDLGSANEVARVYRRVQQLQQGDGPLFLVGCRDMYFRCYQPGNPYALPGYSEQYPTKHKAGRIVMCPLGLAMNRNPKPCSQRPGSIFLGWLMLRLLAYLDPLSHLDAPADRGGSETAAQIGAMVSKGINTTHNPNALAFLGSWSWDLGLGGPPWNQGRTCLGRFVHGAFDADLEHLRDFVG
ncbi:MAG: hypothetical protein LQ350_006901 [Teloschistes chrysophthalmus]|nr:MAG: hypothetical protein LQ350_006901 [Niorma chrysophthalma]